MQLEFNFTSATDMQTTMKDFFDNLYSIFITLQIITGSVK